MFRILTPHLRIERIEQLSVERLHELKLKTLLLDVDCTLKSYSSEEIAPEVAAWLTEVREAGIQLCLVSNGRKRRIAQFAKKIDLPFLAKACKPLPFRLQTALRKMNSSQEQTAMVGDQLFADIMAGRLAGLFTIIVQPIRPEEEPWFTRAKRPFERWILSKSKHREN